MNNYIINDPADPLYINDINSDVSLNANGNIYSVSLVDYAIETFLIAKYLSLYISNPSGSAKNIYIMDYSVTVRGVSIGLINYLVRNGSLTSSNTLTPYNNNFSKSNSSVAIVKYGESSGSGSDTMILTFQAVSLYNEVCGSSICLPPNSSILLRLETNTFNVLGITQTISINVTWCEK